MEKERLTEELGSTKVNQLDETTPIPEEDTSGEPINDENVADLSLADDLDPRPEDQDETLNGNTAVESQDNSAADSSDSISQEVTTETDPVATQNEVAGVSEEEEKEGEGQTETIEGVALDNQSTQEGDAKDDKGESEEKRLPDPQETDYNKLSKEELLDKLVDLTKVEDYGYIGKVLKIIRPLFDTYVKKERSEAYERYVADGGEKDGFEYQLDEVSQKFNANYNLLWDRKQQHFKNLEKRKDENLKVKNELLEKLREITDAEESGTSIKEVKAIQDKWKEVGPVPRQHNRTLWANYNALLDRYYDHRSIYFELKELDRKKNLEAKVELCEKAEALALDENINRAVQELNHLHEEYKHVGPVPKEAQEETWLRFKAASDSIYSKRKVHVDELKEKLEENLEAKQVLCDQLESFLSFQSDKMTEWNGKTKEILELQKSWEKIGGLPRDKSKVVNKRFWSSFKGFFANKNKFFKTLEGKREDNLKLKEELVSKAESLKDNEDFNKTADLLKGLQREWKEIGPVPEKFKNEIYKRFKAACDEFFNRKRAQVKESEKEFQENLTRKQSICDQLEEIGNADKIDLDLVEALQTQYSEIGFVPRSSVKSINGRYDEVIEKLTEVISESDLEGKEQIVVGIEIRKMKGRPGSNKSIHKQENSLRKQISTIENDINTWRNNLEFFRDSKTANQLKKDFDVKIDAANQELKKLKKQLRMMEDAAS